MPLFRRRRREAEVPEWAAFFDRPAYATFVGLVDGHLERRGLPREWGDGAIRTVVAGQELTLGLGNLAQLVHGEPQSEWAAIVADHLDRLVRLHEAGDAALGFEDARTLLKLRLWARADLPEEASVVARPFADDLAILLSLDLPESVSTVTEEQAAAWARPVDELFAIAAEQTQAEPELHVERLQHAGGVEAFACVSDSFFAGTQALWPERIAGTLPPDGALVAAPNRHFAYVLPLRDAGVIGVMNEAIPWLHQRHLEGPGSISPHLYWVRDAEVTRQPTTMRGDTAELWPTDDFVGVLNRLAGGER